MLVAGEEPWLKHGNHKSILCCLCQGTHSFGGIGCWEWVGEAGGMWGEPWAVLKSRLCLLSPCLYQPLVSQSRNVMSDSYNLVSSALLKVLWDKYVLEITESHKLVLYKMDLAFWSSCISWFSKLGRFSLHLSMFLCIKMDIAHSTGFSTTYFFSIFSYLIWKYVQLFRHPQTEGLVFQAILLHRCFQKACISSVRERKTLAGGFAHKCSSHCTISNFFSSRQMCYLHLPFLSTKEA